MSVFDAVNFRERMAIFGLILLALCSLFWLGLDSKDILIAVVSGLLGYLKGTASPASPGVSSDPQAPPPVGLPRPPGDAPQPTDGKE